MHLWLSGILSLRYLRYRMLRDDVNCEIFFTVSQICRFCWHRIRTDENGLCPACRKAYPEDPADFKPLSKEDFARIKAEKRQKNQQKKQKITENRKSLGNVRVVQKNLVFVLGLPTRLADAEVSSRFVVMRMIEFEY